MSKSKRDDMKERIEAAQARNVALEEKAIVQRVGEKAVEAKDDFTDFARKHPVAIIAGGVVAGILISALFKGSPTRKAAVAVKDKSSELASIGSEAAIAFAREMMDATAEIRQAGADKIEDLNDAVGDKTRGIKRKASHRIEDANDTARIAARDLGKTIARSFRKH